MNRYKTCPQAGKILEYYAGIYESVYVIINPFYYLNSIKDEQLNFEQWPHKLEILEKATEISWEQILKLTNIDNFKELDYELRHYFHSDFDSKLKKLMDEKRIMHPGSGEISPFTENDLLNRMKKLGFESIWLADEFDTARKKYLIKDLITKDRVSVAGCLYTLDHSLLITTNWENFCTYLCSSNEVVKKIVNKCNFEGFYCDDNTEVWEEFDNLNANKSL
jgi:hypothetical protein